MDALFPFLFILGGIACVWYGRYTLRLRKTDPDKFGKLRPMQALWGERLGYGIHVVGYSVVPIAFGALLVLMGLMELLLLLLGSG